MIQKDEYRYVIYYLGLTMQTKNILRSGINIRGCQIGMQGPQLCAKPRHFCKLDVATSRMAFLNLNLHVLQVATSNSNN